MNNIIEFKKDCIMKTMVSEITDISLTHDYKIMDDTVEGYFDVTGEYKITKGSIEKEEFMYTIPFTIALSSMIDKSTINLTISDFNYEIDKDVLHLKMALNMEYEEIKPIEEETEESDILSTIEEKLEEENAIENTNEIEEKEENMINNENEYHNELMDDLVNEMDKEEAENSVNKIISNMEESSYYKYKIYIMREEDTLESIAIKYNVSLENLREYNDLENINIGDKIIIPIISNDKQD